MSHTPRGRSSRKTFQPKAPGPSSKSFDAPTTLGAALTRLIAIRGLAQERGDAQLKDLWSEVAGPKIAQRTVVMGIQRGVLQIAVVSSAMLGELVSYHKLRLIEELKTREPRLKLRDIKFRLRGDLAPPELKDP